MAKKLSALISALSYLTLVPAVYAQGLLQPPAGTVGTDIDVKNVPQLVVSLLFGLAILLAVVYLLYGGIKWITSRGDKVAVEVARKQIIAAIIGLVVVAGTFFILNLVFNILGVDNPLKQGFTLPTLRNPSPGR